MKIVFDIETVALPDAAEYLEPVSAPANYKDPIKIAAYVEDAQREQVERSALDVDLCQVVAIGWYREGETSVQALTRQDCDEDGLIQEFWKQVSGPPYLTFNPVTDKTPMPIERQLIGFNCLAFDLPVLMRRSQYLGISYPHIQIDKYRHAQITDLSQVLSFNGAVRLRSLAFYAKRFGVKVDDPMTGADVAQAVAESRWADVRNHVTADVQKTAQLAEKIGLLRMPAVVL